MTLSRLLLVAKLYKITYKHLNLNILENAMKNNESNYIRDVNIIYLPGHPDKLCDRIVDYQDAMARDPKSLVGLKWLHQQVVRDWMYYYSPSL